MKHAPAVNGYSKVLSAREAELLEALRKRDGIAIEKSADQMDEIQYAVERELAIRSADLDSNLLRQVRAALQRIEQGGFGICIDCDEPINPKRVAAVPWAPRCVQCQEAAERNRRGRPADAENELMGSVV